MNTESPTLETLAERYLALEQRTHRIIGALSGRFCAACATPCCHSKHCSDVLDSPWLRLLATRQGVALPEGDSETDEVSFLSTQGCKLRAGRPVQCTWYICEDLGGSFADLDERFLYQVASDVLGHVVRRVTRDHDLVDIDLDALTDVRRRRLQTRMIEAEQSLDDVERLLAARKRGVPPDDLAATLCRMAARFPYAARTSAADMARGQTHQK